MRRLLPEPRTVSVCFHSSEPGATPVQRLTTVGVAAAVLLLVSCALTEVKRTAAITQGPIKNVRSLLFIEFAPSAVRHFQDGFWKALALNWNFQSCRIDLINILPRQLDRSGADVLFQSIYLRRSWNWNDPRLLCEQPRQRDLRGSGVFAPRNAI